jgi:hypothetical protein
LHARTHAPHRTAPHRTAPHRTAPHALTHAHRYNNLLDCYEKWGRVDKASEVERKLVALRQYVADHPNLSFGD